MENTLNKMIHKLSGSKWKTILISFVATILIGIVASIPIWKLYHREHSTETVREQITGQRTIIIYDSAGNEVYKEQNNSFTWLKGKPTCMETVTYQNLNAGETYMIKVEVKDGDNVVGLYYGEFVPYIAFGEIQIGANF